MDKKELQQKMGKRNRTAGKGFERRTAKRIAYTFGWDWQKFADRAGAGHKQSHDAVPHAPYSDRFPYWWECKYRQGWSLRSLFRDPKKSIIYQWFIEARDDAPTDLNPLLVFSMPHQPVFCMTDSVGFVVLDDDVPMLGFVVDDEGYYVMLFDDFLGAI